MIAIPKSQTAAYRKLPSVKLGDSRFFKTEVYQPDDKKMCYKLHSQGKFQQHQSNCLVPFVCTKLTVSVFTFKCKVIVFLKITRRILVMLSRWLGKTTSQKKPQQPGNLSEVLKTELLSWCVHSGRIPVFKEQQTQLESRQQD